MSGNKIKTSEHKSSAEQSLTQGEIASSTNGINSESEINNQNFDIEKEIGGRKGLDPTRYGDWESKGRCIDF